MQAGDVGVLRAPGARRRVLLGVLALMVLASPAAGQMVQLQAGSSSLFSAHGGSVNLRARGSSATFGAGRLGDKLTVGFWVRKSLRDVSLSIGDEAVDFRLPTDLFGGSRYLPVRGAGLEFTRGGSRLKFLAGASSTMLGAPFFRGADSNQPLGLLFYEGHLSSRWRVFSNSVLSRRHTSIHGIEWHPHRSLKLAVAGGVGSEKPYVASSAALDRGWVSMNAVYVQQQTGFRRLAVDSPMAAELARENLSLTLRPAPWWSVSGARQTLLNDATSGVDAGAVTINQAGASINGIGLRLIGAVYDSHGQRGDNLGSSLSVGRRVSDSFDVVLDYFRSDPSDARPAHSTVLRLQETLSPRVALLQTITRSGGQMTLGVGGEFLSNPLRVGVSQQTVYAPFRSGSPFVQVIGVDVRLNFFDRVELQGGTYTTPDGRLRYTVSGTHVLSLPGDSGGGNRRPFTFQRYLVQGRVRDTDEQPVAGAVIQLGGETVLTDDEGLFFLRTSRANRLELGVATAEFLAPGRFEVIAAPVSVTPAIDGRAPEILIVVRRR